MASSTLIHELEVAIGKDWSFQIHTNIGGGPTMPWYVTFIVTETKQRGAARRRRSWSAAST